MDHIKRRLTSVRAGARSSLLICLASAVLTVVLIGVWEHRTRVRLEEHLRSLAASGLNADLELDSPDDLVFVCTLDPTSLLEVVSGEADDDIKNGAWVALSIIGTHDLIPRLMTMYRASDRLRFSTSLALARIGRGSRDVNLFFAAEARNPDYPCAMIAINALACSAPYWTIEHVRDLTHHPNPHIRATVLEAIRRTPSREAIPLLIDMMSDNDYGLAVSGSSPLRRILIGAEAIREVESRTGISFGGDCEFEFLFGDGGHRTSERWRRWYQTAESLK